MELGLPIIFQHDDVYCGPYYTVAQGKVTIHLPTLLIIANVLSFAKCCIFNTNCPLFKDGTVLPSVT